MATSVIKKSLLYGISAIAVIGIVGFSYSVYQDYKEVERVADAKNSFTFYEMCRETFEGSGDSKIYCSEKFITHEKLSVDAYENCKSDYYNDLKAQGFNTRHMEDSENKKGCGDAQVNIIASSNSTPSPLASNNASDNLASQTKSNPSYINQKTQIFTEKFHLNSENSSALGIPFVGSYKKPQCIGHDKTTSIPCTVIINNERRGVTVFREETIWVGYHKDRYADLMKTLNETYQLNYIINYGLTSKACFDNCRVVIDNTGDVSTISYHRDTKAERIRKADISQIRREESQEMAITNSKVNTL